MINDTILSILFSTIAAIVATLTGLIGGFATFRLQRMDAKYDTIKKMTARNFLLSMSFIFVTLSMLLVTNAISTFSFKWLFLIVFFLLAALIFYGFISQVKTIIV